MKEEKLKLEVEKAEEVIKERIFIIRKRRVMVDADLAKLYGVATKVFNQAVKRNANRFPDDFMFQLTEEEVVTNCDHLINLRFSYHLPYVFTEHGVAMLSSVLNSERAVQMNIFIIRAFIKMRELLKTTKDLGIKIDELEKKQKEQGDILSTVNNTVKQMIDKPLTPKGKLGFN